MMNENAIEEREKSVLKTSHEPEINQIKRRQKNTLLSKLLFALVSLIVISFMGLKFYPRLITAEEKKGVPTHSVDRGEISANKRTDLSEGYNPFARNENESNNKESKTSDTSEDNPADTVANTSGFKKYLSIPLAGQFQASSSPVLAEKMQESDNAAVVENNDPSAVKKSVSAVVTAISLDPNLYIRENTYIPCSLATRFISAVKGRLSCVISEDIYSVNGHTKLIEKGTLALGAYRSGTLKQGVSRLFVIWEQLRTADHKKISLVDTQVVGQLGEAGIDGWIDSHFWQRFGGALMLSTVQDVAAAAANNVSSKERQVDYTENSRDALAEMAKTALENTINIPPTIYKNQGDRMGILVGQDIDFSKIYTLKLKTTESS